MKNFLETEIGIYPAIPAFVHDQNFFGDLDGVAEIMLTKEFEGAEAGEDLTQSLVNVLRRLFEESGGEEVKAAVSVTELLRPQIDIEAVKDFMAQNPKIRLHLKVFPWDANHLIERPSPSVLAELAAQEAKFTISPPSPRPRM